MNATRPGSWMRWVKVDPFAICDLAREQRLTANEQHVLLIMAIQSEYRSSEWVGSLTTLTDATRLGRNTATKAVRRLVELGELEVVEIFRPGDNPGRVRILNRDRLIYANPSKLKAASIGSNGESNDRAPTASLPRSYRAPTAPDGASDQEEGGGPQVRRQRGKGVSDDRHGKDMRCRCGLPMKGHPFSDHEPEKPINGAEFQESPEAIGPAWEVRREVVHP